MTPIFLPWPTLFAALTGVPRWDPPHQGRQACERVEDSREKNNCPLCCKSAASCYCANWRGTCLLWDGPGKNKILLQYVCPWCLFQAKSWVHFPGALSVLFIIWQHFKNLASHPKGFFKAKEFSWMRGQQLQDHHNKCNPSNSTLLLPQNNLDEWKPLQTMSIF